MANSGFASSQPLSCDFLSDQAREDLAFGLFGRRPGWPHQAPFRRRSARIFAGLCSPETTPMTRLPQSLERGADLFHRGRQINRPRPGFATVYAAGNGPGGRRCAKRRRAYPRPTQAPFLAYPASARRRGSTDGYSLTHEPPG